MGKKKRLPLIGIMMTDHWNFETRFRPWNCHGWVPGRHQPGVSRSRLWTFLPTWEKRGTVGRTPSRLHCPRHKCFIGSSFLRMVNPKKWEMSENRLIGIFHHTSAILGSLMETPIYGCLFRACWTRFLLQWAVRQGWSRWTVVISNLAAFKA